MEKRIQSQDINLSPIKKGKERSNDSFNQFQCVKCGYITRLEYPGNSIAGKCEDCQRFTIFKKVNIEFDKEKYFSDGKFYPKLLADDIINEYHCITFADTDEVYIYKEGIYVEGEAFIKRICEETLQNDANIRRVSEVVNHIKRQTYIERKNIADSNPNFLCVKNGVLNLSNIKEGEIKLLPHTPDMIFLKKLPVEYQQVAGCPKIKQFLNEIVRERDIPIIQEMIGYCLWKRYDIDKAFLLVGDGANGKSTFLELITKFLGKENVTSIALQNLENNRFAKAELWGKFANIHSDLPDRALTHTGIFKMLTGGDLISADRKFRGHINFVNYAKLIFACNKIPEARDDTDAFYRRWVIIDFPNKFENDEADPFILDKISTPEELAGLLNWALEGLKRLLKNGRFSHSISTEETRDRYIKASNPVLAFIDECIKSDFLSHEKKDVIYLAFCNFCRDVGLPTKAKNVFARELPQYINVEVERVTQGNERVRVWKGIRLNERGKKYVQDGQDVQDILYFNYNNNHDSIKIRKNLDILDNPATADKIGGGEE